MLKMLLFLNTRYFWLTATILLVCFSNICFGKPNTNNISNGCKISAATSETYYRDLYPDTWVGIDALGRKLPSFEEVGVQKNDKKRIVGIFYITWHTQNCYDKFKSPYSADVSKILKANPGARLDAKNSLWTEKSYHWGEPEMGYFLSQDEYIIRKDMSMLADAGVDVLIMDVTNGVRYWDEWEVLFSKMEKMKAEGSKVPEFCFWAYGGQVITVVQELYDRIYKNNRFKSLWFYWDEKPLLLYNGSPLYDPFGKEIKNLNPHYDAATKTDVKNPHYLDKDFSEEYYKDYTKEVKSFFTKRTMWWGYYEWAGGRFVGTEDNWSFGYNLDDPRVKALKPEELLSTHNGRREEAAVTPAQHPVTMTDKNMGVGKSWTRKDGQPPLNEFDLCDSAYVPWLGKVVKHPEGYGIYFQERWDEALAADPDFLYLNDWNEWTAGKYQPKESNTTPWLGRNNSFYFVDQYNSEFNRCIQPMKDGYTDNYYMQMAENIRKYKGIRPIPKQQGLNSIKIDGKFNDWMIIDNEFRDTKGDTFHRNHNGYGGLKYTNESGRNDIFTCKVAVDKQNINFYIETSGKITNYTDNNWMLLLIDSDNNSETGWYGYDFVINKKVKNINTTTLMHYNANNLGNEWTEIADLKLSYVGNKLEIAVPRKQLELNKDSFTFDFKWSDNASELLTPISLCVNGDAAPNRRFNYRYIWKLR